MKIVFFLTVCSLLNTPLSAAFPPGTPANSRETVRTVHIVVVDSLEWLDMLADMYELNIGYIRYCKLLYDSMARFMDAGGITCLGEDGSTAAALLYENVVPQTLALNTSDRDSFIRYPVMRLFLVRHVPLFGAEPEAARQRCEQTRSLRDQALSLWSSIKNRDHSLPVTPDQFQPELDSIVAIVPRWLEERYGAGSAAQRITGILRRLDQQAGCTNVLVVVGPQYEPELIWRAYRAYSYRYQLRISKIVRPPSSY